LLSGKPGSICGQRMSGAQLLGGKGARNCIFLPRPAWSRGPRLSLSVESQLLRAAAGAAAADSSGWFDNGLAGAVAGSLSPEIPSRRYLTDYAQKLLAPYLLPHNADLSYFWHKSEKPLPEKVYFRILSSVKIALYL